MNSLPYKIYKVLCGDFNGIQVFWSPGTLIPLLSSSGILAALSSALSFRIHYMPLFIFLIMGFYVIYVTLKLKLFYQIPNGDFTDAFIGLNLSVLGLFLISLIVYAVSGFMLYFYGIDGILKPLLLLLFKSYTALIILYHYLLWMWLRPFYARRYGRQRAFTAMVAWQRKNIYAAVRYTLMMILMVLAAIKVYQILLSYVLQPVLDGLVLHLKINLQLHMTAFYNLWDIVINLGILILAFLISNLCFYPLVYAVTYIGKRLLPIQTRPEPLNA